MTKGRAATVANFTRVTFSSAKRSTTREQKERGSRPIRSVCSGSFVVARCGSEANLGLPRVSNGLASAVDSARSSSNDIFRLTRTLGPTFRRHRGRRKATKGGAVARSGRKISIFVRAACCCLCSVRDVRDFSLGPFPAGKGCHEAT